MLCDLKPCPFCGSEAELDWGSTYNVSDGMRQDGWVECKSCEASIELFSLDDDKSTADLVEKWNARTKPTLDDLLSQLGDYIVNNNLNYVGGEFTREDQDEPFMVTVSRESALKKLTDHHSNLKSQIESFLDDISVCHQVDKDHTIGSSTRKELEQLLKVLNE